MSSYSADTEICVRGFNMSALPSGKWLLRMVAGLGFFLFMNVLGVLGLLSMLVLALLNVRVWEMFGDETIFVLFLCGCAAGMLFGIYLGFILFCSNEKPALSKKQMWFSIVARISLHLFFLNALVLLAIAFAAVFEYRLGWDNEWVVQTLVWTVLILGIIVFFFVGYYAHLLAKRLNMPKLGLMISGILSWICLSLLIVFIAALMNTWIGYGSIHEALIAFLAITSLIFLIFTGVLFLIMGVRLIRLWKSLDDIAGRIQTEMIAAGLMSEQEVDGQIQTVLKDQRPFVESMVPKSIMELYGGKVLPSISWLTNMKLAHRYLISALLLAWLGTLASLLCSPDYHSDFGGGYFWGSSSDLDIQTGYFYLPHGLRMVLFLGAITLGVIGLKYQSASEFAGREGFNLMGKLIRGFCLLGLLLGVIFIPVCIFFSFYIQFSSGITSAMQGTIDLFNALTAFVIFPWVCLSIGIRFLQVHYRIRMAGRGWVALILWMYLGGIFLYIASTDITFFSSASSNSFSGRSYDDMLTSARGINTTMMLTLHALVPILVLIFQSSNRIKILEHQLRVVEHDQLDIQVVVDEEAQAESIEVMHEPEASDEIVSEETDLDSESGLS